MKTEDVLLRNAFIAEIKEAVPDWKYRISEINKEYSKEKKKNQIVDWNFIVTLQLPKNINLSIWRKFVGMMKSKKQKKQSEYFATGRSRLKQELKDLGGGIEELGQEYLEKYLYD